MQSQVQLHANAINSPLCLLSRFSPAPCTKFNEGRPIFIAMASMNHHFTPVVYHIAICAICIWYNNPYHTCMARLYAYTHVVCTHMHMVQNITLITQNALIYQLPYAILQVTQSNLRIIGDTMGINKE